MCRAGLGIGDAIRDGLDVSGEGARTFAGEIRGRSVTTRASEHGLMIGLSYGGLRASVLVA